MKKLSLILALMFFWGSVVASAGQKVGVLVLAHGGDPLWNTTVTRAVAPLKKNYPVEIAFGMANPQTMQEGIDRLEKQGVNTIVVIQLFVSSFSMIIRQNEYLLGFRDTLADPPMLMMHHMGGGHSHASGSSHSEPMKMHAPHHSMESDSAPVKLKQLDIKARILLTKPLNDHPIVSSIILDRVKELSTNTKEETVILVAHGPNDQNDNRMWLATLHNLSNQIKSAFGTHSFRKVTYLTLRDDAPKEIYDAAKQHFRSVVEEAAEDGGRALIVPVLLSKGGIEKRLQKRLDGLSYVWKGHTLLPDPKITEFMEVSVESALDHLNRFSDGSLVEMK